MLDCNLWICKIMLCSRVTDIARICLLGMPLLPFSEQCVAKPVHGVLLYSTLESAKLHLAVSCNH